MSRLKLGGSSRDQGTGQTPEKGPNLDRRGEAPPPNKERLWPTPGAYKSVSHLVEEIFRTDRALDKHQKMVDHLSKRQALLTQIQATREPLPDSEDEKIGK
ncbi:uncharacterized protein N7496_010099 [Penicillium cataractarum]|uniref:Uncharacterized protein n=1 Tax=Penicillium cataractarum TaxID=2100454 RepID=A0A9W9RQN9_9EURO|nr:uncharacterized protein N7496_010099 [Penicillium cataractarum]KAJ5364386.1 hypothetical protein N7496_010099 [Penicillium cataractarum]